MESSRKKILLVDDEPHVLKLLGGRLRASGFEVLTAEDGETALKKVREEEPGLLLLDVRLPGLDGFEVAHILKSNPETKEIPIIIISAHAQKSDLIRGRTLGVEGYLVKPVDSRQLLEEISRVLDAQELNSGYAKTDPHR